MHGVRQQRDRTAGPGLPGTRSPCRRRGFTDHPLGIGVLHPASREPGVRLSVGGLLRPGTGHRCRRLRRLRARRPRHHPDRTAAGDAQVGGKAALRPAPCRRAGRARRNPVGRPLPARPGDGGCALRGAGRRGHRVAGLLRADRCGPGERHGRIVRHHRAFRVWPTTPAGFGRDRYRSRLRCRTGTVRRSRARSGSRVRRTGRHHAGHHHRPARRGPDRHQPVGPVGYRCRHPNSVQQQSEGDRRRSRSCGNGTGRRPGQRIRR